jgi:hypothetical protein
MNKISLRRWRWLAVPLAACLTVACTSAAAADPAVSGSASGSASAAAPLNCAPPDVKLIPCFSPRAYEVAYGVAPLLSRGIDGHGVTVAIPALAQVPPITAPSTTWSPATTRWSGRPGSSPATTLVPAGDPVTGWGSPDATYLVPLLARTALSQ